MTSDEEIRKILSSPVSSQWLREALCTALSRDPVQAARDAEVLAQALSRRLDTIILRETADIEAHVAIQRARLYSR